MVRVCVAIFLSLVVLSGCASEQTQPTATVSHISEPQPQENIIACTGLPVAGQKCGLALPKL
jgi:hypothetical protein